MGIKIKIYIFITVIFIPTMLLPFSFHRTSINENRQLAAFPSVTNYGSFKNFLKDFPGDFEDYYRDHFGFRDFMIQTMSWIRKDLFSKPLSQRVVYGKDGWLFYNKTGDGDPLTRWRGLMPLTQKQIQRFYDNLVIREKRLSARGISYYFVVTPNKHTIYPEKIRAEYNKVGPTPREQIVSQMDLPIFVDLTEHLQNRKQRQLYYKTDTHWNKLGAYLGYQALFKKVSQKYPELSPVTYKFESDNIKQIVGGDLARILSKQDQYSEIEYKGVIPNLCAKEIRRISSKEFIKGCEQKKLRAFVVRDSFFDKLEPYVSEHFKEVYYYSGLWDDKSIYFKIQQFQPDIVIEQQVERLIQKGL